MGYGDDDWDRDRGRGHVFDPRPTYGWVVMDSTVGTLFSTKETVTVPAGAVVCPFYKNPRPSGESGFFKVDGVPYAVDLAPGARLRRAEAKVQSFGDFGVEYFVEIEGGAVKIVCPWAKSEADAFAEFREKLARGGLSVLE